MKCPLCGVDDDKVIDSRGAEDGGAIRRRRECLGCGRRFTTFERVEEVPLVVLKRSGAVVPFERARIVDGIRAASKNRPVSDEQMEALAFEVEEQSRLVSGDLTTESIGLAVLYRRRTGPIATTMLAIYVVIGLAVAAIKTAASGV